MTSRTKASAATALACLLATGDLRAQGLQSTSGFGSLGADSAFGAGGIPTRGPQDTGLKLGEEALFHAGIGAEAGYDTNVFYENAALTGAALLRVTPFVELTNATRAGVVPTGVHYDLLASLQYREFLSDLAVVRAQRAFNPAVGGTLNFSSGQKLSFTLSDQFVRLEDPPYGETQGTITRDSNLAAARLLTYRAATICEQGGNITQAGAMAKLFASEVANKAAYHAVQIFGGRGYLSDFPVERIYRDVRVCQIYEGTSDVQKILIGRALA
jgi:hypothetical protein